MSRLSPPFVKRPLISLAFPDSYIKPCKLINPLQITFRLCRAGGGGLVFPPERRRRLRERIRFSRSHLRPGVSIARVDSCGFWSIAVEVVSGRFVTVGGRVSV